MKEQFKALLEKYVPSEREDPGRKSQFLAFLEENERCFDRKLAIGHVTASAWLLSPDGANALLTYHRKLKKWMQLGGHCEEGDQDVLSAAIREAQEESGLLSIEPVLQDLFDIDIHPIPATREEPAHFHYDARFLLRATDPKETVSLSEESIQLKWIEINTTEIFSTELSVLRLFLKWKRLQHV